MQPSMQVEVRIGESGYRTEISVRGHTLVADEPAGFGGMDEGPTPYDYLAAALGACMAMTMRIYADRRGWPLGGATVRLTHSRIHKQDCEECESQKVGIDQFARVIELSGDLDEEQRTGLLRVADRCPVGQTLARGIRIVSPEQDPTARGDRHT
jgi:uncharacterized OsmC-like protein